MLIIMMLIPFHTKSAFQYQYINKLNQLSLTDCLMIVIMVALPQLNCGRATFSTVYYRCFGVCCSYNCILYIIVLNSVVFPSVFQFL